MKTPVLFSATLILLFVVGEVECKYGHDLCQYSPTGKDNCLMAVWFYVGWVVVWCLLTVLATVVLMVCYCSCGLGGDKLKDYMEYLTGILMCCSCPCLVVLALCKSRDEDDDGGYGDTWSGAA